MAAQHEIQFYSAMMEYKIWDFVSNVNLNYQKIINCIPTKMPFMNTWHQQFFSANKRWHWDKQSFWLKKREWMEKCFDRELWLFTDIVEFEWDRFAIWKNNNGRHKRIFKQCYAWEYIWCEKILSKTAKEWNWIEVWSFSDYECTYNKFTKTIWPIWKSKYQSCNAYIWHRLVWNAVISFLYILDWNWNKITINGINAWDWLYVYDAWWSSVVSWQMLQTSWFDSSTKEFYFWEKFWLWLSSDASLIGTGNNEIIDWPCCIKIFTEIWSTLMVVWSDWLWQMNDVDCSSPLASEWTIMWQTKYDSNNGTSFNPNYIRSVTTINWWLVIMTKQSVSFMRAWSFVNQNLFGTIYNTFVFDEDRDTMTRVQDFIILMWPRTTWIAYRSSISYNTINWQTNYNYEYDMLLNNLWYFSKWSILNFQEKLYFVSNSIEQEWARFWRVVLNVGNAWSKPIFWFDLDDMSNHWVNTDFMALNKQNGDEIFLSKNDYEILVFITDNNKYDDDDIEDQTWPWTKQPWTKILIYDDRFKFWHRWYLCWIDIKHRSWNCRYGNWIWANMWDKDDGEDFKQIISMTFWDTSFYSMKNLAYLKMWIWYNSSISNKTTYSVSSDSWWEISYIKTNSLYRTRYVSTINMLANSWMSDAIHNHWSRNLVYKNILWKWVYAWNWVWLSWPYPQESITDISQLCSYDPSYQQNCTECNANHNDISWWSIQPVLPYEDSVVWKAQNFSSDNFSDVHYVSKYSMLKRTLWKQWHMFVIEICADWTDKVEFLWWFIWYVFMDNTMEHLSNTIDFCSTPETTKSTWNTV